MVDLEGVTLKLLLNTGDLDSFAKLKSAFFSSAYTPIYREINKYYFSKGVIPSFDVLSIYIRDAALQNSIAALGQLDVPDAIDLDLAVEALINKYAQSEILNSIDNFLDNITLLDVSEIKEGISTIALELDDKLHTSENIVYADQIQIFRTKEESDSKVTPTGISNELDADVGGLFDEDLVLLGGKRGSGKSITCANLCVAQYDINKTSVYYTVEMPAQEIYGRIMCILANVEYSGYKKNILTKLEELALVKKRAEFFVDAEDLVTDYELGRIDSITFETKLISTKKRKPEGQIIVIDDRELSIATIDLTLQKLIAEYKDNLSLVVVDYLNQLTMDKNKTKDMYDWKEQLILAKTLKNLARKYKRPIISPFQIDEQGNARMSKGILDACDLAMNLVVDGDYIKLKCVKSRSSRDNFEFAQPINWKTLTISPATVSVETLLGEESESGEETTFSKKPKFMATKVPGGVDDI